MNADQQRQIEALYLEMFDALKAYAKCTLISDALSEEAVQETFRIACQKPDALCGSPNPKGWLVITLRYTISNFRSRMTTAKRIIEQYLKNHMADLSLVEDHINVNILYQDIAESDDFKLLWEMAIEGRSHKEMAASRGITVDACKKRVQRAKEKLQKKTKP